MKANLKVSRVVDGQERQIRETAGRIEKGFYETLGEFLTRGSGFKHAIDGVPNKISILAIGKVFNTMTSEKLEKGYKVEAGLLKYTFSTEFKVSKTAGYGGVTLAGNKNTVYLLANFEPLPLNEGETLKVEWEIVI